MILGLCFYYLNLASSFSLKFSFGAIKSIGAEAGLMPSVLCVTLIQFSAAFLSRVRRLISFRAHHGNSHL